MAPRHFSPESSPDPLALDYPLPSRSTAGITMRKRQSSRQPQASTESPIASSSTARTPTKSRSSNSHVSSSFLTGSHTPLRRPTVQVLSPTKTQMTTTTMAGGSPWRIKVMVEAEPEKGTSSRRGGSAVGSSPAPKRKTTTTPRKPRTTTARKVATKTADGPEGSAAAEKRVKRTATPRRPRVPKATAETETTSAKGKERAKENEPELPTRRRRRVTTKARAEQEQEESRQALERDIGNLSLESASGQENFDPGSFRFSPSPARSVGNRSILSVDSSRSNLNLSLSPRGASASRTFGSSIGKASGSIGAGSRLRNTMTPEDDEGGDLFGQLGDASRISRGTGSANITVTPPEDGDGDIWAAAAMEESSNSLPSISHLNTLQNPSPSPTPTPQKIRSGPSPTTTLTTLNTLNTHPAPPPIMPPLRMSSSAARSRSRTPPPASKQNTNNADFWDQLESSTSPPPSAPRRRVMKAVTIAPKKVNRSEYKKVQVSGGEEDDDSDIGGMSGSSSGRSASIEAEAERDTVQSAREDVNEAVELRDDQELGLRSGKEVIVVKSPIVSRRQLRSLSPAFRRSISISPIVSKRTESKQSEVPKKATISTTRTASARSSIKADPETPAGQVRFTPPLLPDTPLQRFNSNRERPTPDLQSVSDAGQAYQSILNLDPNESMSPLIFGTPLRELRDSQVNESARASMAREEEEMDYEYAASAASASVRGVSAQREEEGAVSYPALPSREASAVVDKENELEMDKEVSTYESSTKVHENDNGKSSQTTFASAKDVQTSRASSVNRDRLRPSSQAFITSRMKRSTVEHATRPSEEPSSITSERAGKKRRTSQDSTHSALSCTAATAATVGRRKLASKTSRSSGASSATERHHTDATEFPSVLPSAFLPPIASAASSSKTRLQPLSLPKLPSILSHLDHSTLPTPTSIYPWTPAHWSLLNALLLALPSHSQTPSGLTASIPPGAIRTDLMTKALNWNPAITEKEFTVGEVEVARWFCGWGGWEEDEMLRRVRGVWGAAIRRGVRGDERAGERYGWGGWKEVGAGRG